MRAGSELFTFLRRLLLLGLGLGVSVATADLAVLVLPLKHRMPDDVIPALRPLLAPNESINGYDTRLIVRASPATLKQIERVLAEIDTKRRNLRISVRHGESLRHQEQDTGMAAEARSGNTRIVVGNDTHTNRGATLSAGTRNNNIQVHSERRVTTRQENLSQTLTVMDGGKGFLRVGESIPMVQTYLALIGHRPGLVTGIQYYDVSTGFDVEPHVIGERIQLLLSPRLAFRSGQGTQVVEMRELRTQVLAIPGEWTDIGSAVESANEVNRTILSGQSRTHSGHSSFQVKVDPQP